MNNPFRFSAPFVYDEMQTSPPVEESALRLHLKNANFSRLVFVTWYGKVKPIQLRH